MTSPGTSETVMPSRRRSGEHQALLDEVIALILPAQTPGRVAADDIAGLAEAGRAHGWTDVVLAADYVAVLASRYDAAIDGAGHLTAMLDGARGESDEVWEALALAMGATDAVHDGRPRFVADRDLARASVLLEDVPADHDMLPSAHGQCAEGYRQRGMASLALHHTQAAVEYLERGARDEWRMATAMYNRAEIEVRRLCDLRQAGPDPALGQVGELARVAARRVPVDLLPESWGTDLHIYENLTDAIAPPARGAPRPTAQREGAEFAALLDLAAAFSQADPALARASVARALEGLDPVKEPELHLLALTRDAELEAAELGHESAGLRLGRELAARRQQARTDAVEAMASLIREERMLAEHLRLRVAAEVDALTGVSNRRGLDRHVEQLADRHGHGEDARALVLVDVDHFKAVNDTHGHDVGDEVLVRVAGSLRTVVRDTDLVVRWGGDEFLLLLDTDDLEAATRRCLAVAAGVRGEPWDDLAPGLAVTVSIGLAIGKVSVLHDVREAADRALYRAKAGGRDGVAT